MAVQVTHQTLGPATGEVDMQRPNLTHKPVDLTPKPTASQAFFFFQSKQIKNVQQRHKQIKQNTIAKANLCINQRISRLNTGREVEVNASTGKLFQREMVAGRKEELDLANG